MSVETTILLLPDAKDLDVDDDAFIDACKLKLVRTPGCISVAINTFSALPSSQSCTRRYAVVTFRRDKTTSEILKQVLREEFSEAPRELSSGMLHKMQKLHNPPSPQITVASKEEPSYYAMSTCSDEETTQADGLEALDWWGLNDDYSRAASESCTNATPSEMDNNDGYLSEAAGTQQAVLSFMAPMLGIFGFDRARSLNDRYGTSWAIQE